VNKYNNKGWYYTNITHPRVKLNGLSSDTGCI